jgi:hypothetical protein
MAPWTVKCEDLILQDANSWDPMGSHREKPSKRKGSDMLGETQRDL